uniref:Uncharacterized protein n=1 Tax=Geladintestivirus 2 TaxID=3233134 RepID=A0AAU8MIC6_9CAUD
MVQKTLVHLKDGQIYHILCDDKTKGKLIRRIYMTSITEKEEEELDNMKTYITINKSSKSFYLHRNQIYCYGDVDFHKEEDLNQIDSFDFLYFLKETGIPIYSNYNYDTHSCSLINNKLMWTETWKPSVLAKMAHGYIGKPRKIIIFYQDIKQ